MPSSYTTRNRLTKQATGENTNTWGIILNGGVFDLVDFLSDGITTVSASGASTLTTANGSTDQARARVLNVTATSTATVTIPAVEKAYLVRAATADVIVTTGGATTATIKAGDSAWVWCDGSAVRKAQSSDFANAILTRIGYPSASTDGANKQYVDDQAFAATIPSFPALAGNAGNVLTVNSGETNVGWVSAFPAQTGNDRKFLSTDGTDPAWTYPIQPLSRKTANYTAVTGDRLACDTTSGPFTVTLPATPATRDRVVLVDGGASDSAGGWGANTLTIARNGSTINGISDDILLTTKGAAVTLEYLNSTWRMSVGG